jgi:hypothetical protein
MNTPNLSVPSENDALRGDLRPSEQPPRPIPCPQTSPRTIIGGER